MSVVSVVSGSAGSAGSAGSVGSLVGLTGPAYILVDDSSSFVIPANGARLALHISGHVLVNGGGVLVLKDSNGDTVFMRHLEPLDGFYFELNINSGCEVVVYPEGSYMGVYLAVSEVVK